MLSYSSRNVNVGSAIPPRPLAWTREARPNRPRLPHAAIRMGFASPRNASGRSA